MAKEKTQYVTIPLEEYKELLLRETPADKDKMVLERILLEYEACIEYREKVNSWDSDQMKDHLVVTGREKDLIKEITRILKYTDFERYMQVWNKKRTQFRENLALEEKMKQMNEAKEIRDGEQA